MTRVLFQNWRLTTGITWYSRILTGAQLLRSHTLSENYTHHHIAQPFCVNCYLTVQSLDPAMSFSSSNCRHRTGALWQSVWTHSSVFLSQTWNKEGRRLDTHTIEIHYLHCLIVIRATDNLTVVILKAVCPSEAPFNASQFATTCPPIRFYNLTQKHHEFVSKEVATPGYLWISSNEHSCKIHGSNFRMNLLG